MCGIAGIINLKGEKIPEHDIRNMMKVLEHRGPDDEGLFFNDNVGLGHVRLSIIDLSRAGHQPMFDSSGRYCILHNGEVYNYLELKNQLVSKYEFRSQTDTEVILYAYLEWGKECLRRFNGMFAFVIYDKKENTVFIARDRFGIKPMYYFLDNELFIFASEIGAILEVMPVQGAVSDSTIFDYLVFNRTDQSMETFIKQIKRLDHGYFLVFKQNEAVFQRWYFLPHHLGVPFRNSDEFRETFVDAIRLRLRSDVPVGVCLSGGLDSSSIISVMAKILCRGDIQTFSAVYGDGVIGDESKYINLLRDDVFKMHKTTPTAESLRNDMESFIACHGEPVPSTGPYAQYKVMELAQHDVKVLLDGQGGDELLAGYHYFFGTYLKQLLSCWRLTMFFREMNAYYQEHKSLYALQSMLFYFLPHALKSRARLVGRDFLDRDFYERQRSETRLPETLFNARSLQESLLFHFAYKLEHLLKWEDRNSMWFSLESRVPFLDYRLVERTLSLSPENLIRDGKTKYILRKAMENVIPVKIKTRKDKVGYMTPEQEWFRTGPLERFIKEIINSSTFRERPYFNHKRCLELYDRHVRGEINVSRDIWKWINLELWLGKLKSTKRWSRRG